MISVTLGCYVQTGACSSVHFNSNQLGLDIKMGQCHDRQLSFAQRNLPIHYSMGSGATVRPQCKMTASKSHIFGLDFCTMGESGDTLSIFICVSGTFPPCGLFFTCWIVGNNTLQPPTSSYVYMGNIS